MGHLVLALKLIYDDQNPSCSSRLWSVIHEQPTKTKTLLSIVYQMLTEQSHDNVDSFYTDMPLVNYCSRREVHFLATLIHVSLFVAYVQYVVMLCCFIPLKTQHPFRLDRNYKKSI